MFQREHGQLTVQERGAIVALFQHGVHFSEIAERIGCHVNTVRHWAKRYDETLDVKRQIGSGRPLKTTTAQEIFGIYSPITHISCYSVIVLWNLITV